MHAFAFPIIAFIVATTSASATTPAQMYPLLDHANEVTYNILDDLKWCVCDGARDLNIESILIPKGQKKSRTQVQNIQDHPRYQDILNRYLGLCIATYRRDVARAKEGKRPMGAMRVPARQDLPPKLRGMHGDQLKQVNGQLVNCVCSLHLDAWHMNTQPKKLADIDRKIRRCLDDFKPSKANPVSSLAEDDPTVFASARKHPLGLDAGAKKDEGIGAAPSPTPSVDHTPKFQLAGPNPNPKPQDIKQWSHCVLGCMRSPIFTLGDLKDLFGACIGPLECPVPLESNYDQAVRAAEQQLQERQQQLEYILKYKRTEMLLAVFVAAVLIALFGPAALAPLAL